LAVFSQNSFKALRNVTHWWRWTRWHCTTLAMSCSANEFDVISARNVESPSEQE